ncbi:MAG TPA: dihydropteroate synthase [Stellaceae bacterium]|nr:dihydropteroate synthase [Stellaceae bacterium]
MSDGHDGTMGMTTEGQSPNSLAAFAGGAAPALWLRPLGLLRGEAAQATIASGEAVALAGGTLAFTLVEVLALSEGTLLSAVTSLAALRRWADAQEAVLAERVAGQLAALAAPRLPWAGFALDRPLIMGVLNVTPDSFSDGGDFSDPERAIAAGRAMLAAGADIIDIGGESTRPGAAPVSQESEIARVCPVIAALAETGAAVSIDTRHAAVMAAALEKGAGIVNDITALTGDPAAAATVARAGAALVLMHMQGEPRTMQREPRYANAPLEIAAYLAARIEECGAAGIAPERIVIDPGFGFGKTVAHNLELLERLALFHALGTGILLGVSRKSTIGKLSNVAEPKGRLAGSLAGALHGLSQGVNILRVHDVAETRQAVAVWQAIAAAT